jgi:hypothetical protein
MVFLDPTYEKDIARYLLHQFYSMYILEHSLVISIEDKII